METAFRIRASVVLAASLLLPVAHAAVYKSVDPNGHITYSDFPIEGAVVVDRGDSSDIAKRGESGNAPIYLALADSMDEVVAQANAKLDLAEHALALARSSLIEDSPLSLHTPRLSHADANLLNYYKGEVTSARKNLMRVLKQRNAMAPPRPAA